MPLIDQERNEKLIKEKGNLIKKIDKRKIKIKYKGSSIP